MGVFQWQAVIRKLARTVLLPQAGLAQFAYAAMLYRVAMTQHTCL